MISFAIIRLGEEVSSAEIHLKAGSKKARGKTRTEGFASMKMTAQLIRLVIRPQRWSNFEHDGMVNGFLSKFHCIRWFFNGFCTTGPLPLNEWFCGSPLSSMEWSMVFRKMERWSTMVLKKRLCKEMRIATK